MGYTKSRGSVERYLVYLRQLARARPEAENLEWEAENPQRLAHNLRQALHAARFHEEFRHFGRLRSHVQFKVIDSHTVRAVWIELTLLNEALAEEGEIVQQIKIDYEVGLVDLIGAMMEQPQTLEQAYFPLVELNGSEKEQLFKWAEAQMWSIIDHEDAGLTLTKRDIDPELKWSPK